MLKNIGRSKTRIDTVAGTIDEFYRTVLIPATEADRKKLEKLENRKSVVPLDFALGIANYPFKMTPALMAGVAREAVRARSYRDTVEEVKAKYNVCLSVSQIQRVTNFVGLLAFELQKVEAEKAIRPESLKTDERQRRKRANDQLYLMLDGAMLYLRDKEETENGTKGGWEECKSAIAFHSADIRYYRKRTSDEQAHKIQRIDHIALFGDVDEFMPHFLALAQRNGCKQCSEVIIIADGASWIYTQLEKYFPYATIILDKWHAKENAWTFARATSLGAEQQQELGTELCDLIDNGDVDGILTKLKGYRGVKMPEGKVNFYTYTENHKKYMHYDKYEKRGLFVGSGAMESSHKTTLQNRLKSAGMRWNRDTAQGMVSLKTIYESGDWWKVRRVLHILFQCDDQI